MHCDDNSFTVKVDVKDFNPEDLMVKVTGDFVEVQGKHEEKKVQYPRRTFNRTSTLFTNVPLRQCTQLSLCLHVLLSEGWSRIDNSAV